MYVVRIENDEATMYRAFRRVQTAKAWADEKDRDGLASLVDIFNAPDTDDVALAVAATREGRAHPIAHAEALRCAPLVALQARDIGFRHTAR